jgi:NAD(P) transhydrogenase subunit alpha
MSVIGIPKEIAPGETRVAMIPAFFGSFIRDKHTMLVEKGAGEGASIADAEYTKAGAIVVPSAAELYAKADIVLKVQPPRERLNGKLEAESIREKGTYIGFFPPLTQRDVADAFVKRNITSFSMEYIPRITRAQSMDALSSMATVAGYKAVLLATEHLGKMFPLLMTAAGTVPPATVMILGAGVAGLQAIATAKRLGAKVEAYDVRAAVKEQVKSLGAAFIEVDYQESAEAAGGYAREQSPEFIRKQQEALSARLPKTHVVVSTAQVFGKRAPVIITADMVKLMHPGSVIVDLAAEQGGNCELTEPGKTVVKHGITIVGATNLPATIPTDASMMYAKNVLNLFKHLYPKPDAVPDFSDEIVRGACITRDRQIVHEMVRTQLK